MNWTSALNPSVPEVRLNGTVREHICADDTNQERAKQIAMLRAKAKANFRATLANKRKK